MLMKLCDVSTLSGEALNWAVAQYRLGVEWRRRLDVVRGRVLITPTSRYHTPRWADYLSWEQAGPILEEIPGLLLKHWVESSEETRFEARINNQMGDHVAFGPTLLDAALRVYVMSLAGDKIEVPAEVL